MIYKAMVLTKEQSLNPRNLGIGFAMANKALWITLATDVGEGVTTYNTGTTYITIENVPYVIYRDYLLTEENTRLYILRNTDLDNDRIE